jgi:hypothetical protein
MELKEYLKMIKDMMLIENELGLELSETMRIALIQEIAKDLRTQEINKRPDNNLITDKQKNYLMAHGYTRDAVEKMTREEASKLIGESYQR